MQIKTPPPMPSVVKREDKMESLRAFIQAFWLSGPAVGNGSITLVARSAESPIARALAAIGGDIAARGITVRAILGQLEPEKSAIGWSVAGPQIPFIRDLRWAKNPRLADAHEQLVLGPTTAWIGDCLRRDPSRRDAYEQYAANDAVVARTLQTSFERLWAVSEPLLIRTPKSDAAAAATKAPFDEAALAALAPRDDNSGPLASSPH
jgi:hypothetical protein